MINGLVIKKLDQISDERGKVMHMLRSDSKLYTKFGEVYFSSVNPQVVKAWKKHLKMTQHFAVPVGKIELAIYDDREDSKTRGQIENLEIGEGNYCLVKIPPGVWYGFKGISEEPALIANCTDLVHDPEEVMRLDYTSEKIPFKWESK